MTAHGQSGPQRYGMNASGVARAPDWQDAPPALNVMHPGEDSADANVGDQLRSDDSQDEGCVTDIEAGRARINSRPRSPSHSHSSLPPFAPPDRLRRSTPHPIPAYPASGSIEATALAATALRETLATIASLGLTPSFVTETEIILQWRRLSGRTRRSLRPFGRVLASVGVLVLQAPNLLSPLQGHVVINETALARAEMRRLAPIYETIAAIHLGINQARQLAEGLNAQRQRWPLAQVIVLERGGHLFIEPHELIAERIPTLVLPIFTLPDRASGAAGAAAPQESERNIRSRIIRPRFWRARNTRNGA